MLPSNEEQHYWRRECTHSSQHTAPITVHISIWYKSYIDEITTVLLRTGDDTNVKWLFYAKKHSVRLGHWDSLHITV